MQIQSGPKLLKWPFFLGDVALLGAAYFVYFQSRLPMGAWQIFFVVLCVMGGAILGIMPFLLEFRLNMKLAEAQTLVDAAAQFKNLESVAGQIQRATAEWQAVQQQAEKTATLSKSLAERMTAEVKEFTDFMQRANDTEKANLRLEVDKLHRAENEWLLVLVRTLDHVFALHQGALRSNQPRVIEQIGSFQNACREAARRVGLTPYVAEPNESFDAARHQPAEVESKPPPGAVIAETVAAGYTFQGRLVRPALVRLAAEVRNGSAETGESADNRAQSDLPLESAST
ncbi:MAG TPA: nucleotide exchange factor GrpE [Candidatus Dormibacteraeota bacterium]|nr:nucleotide exchange factor GrpE [Candidatus Dormibacteraeota bacterium]